MVLDRLRKALVPGWQGSPSLGMLILRAKQELKHTEELKQHVQEVRTSGCIVKGQGVQERML